jgi:AcrR family transcriptional regulator
MEAARQTFVRKGYDSTTLADIAGDLGVTAAALLRHVHSKQDLFVESMSPGEPFQLPPAILQLDELSSDLDPRVVLRSLAEGFVPFLRGKMQETLVLIMHAQHTDLAGALPFHVGTDSPPAHAVAAVERYFKRLKKGGLLRIDDPRAAALLFLGSIHAYVFFHYVLKIARQPYSLERYIDEMLVLWSTGGIADPAPAARRRGGISGSKKSAGSAPLHSPDRSDPGRRRNRDLPPAEANPSRSRAVGNARSANGQRRLAGGGTSDARPGGRRKPSDAGTGARRPGNRNG